MSLAIGVAATLISLSGGGPETGRPSVPATPSSSPSVERPLGSRVPEGALLLQRGSGGEILSAGSGSGLLPGDHLVVYDISPDGSRVLASIYTREATGIFRGIELLSVSVRTGNASVIARARDRQSLGGPVMWSPDGTRVAYRLGGWSVDPARVHPGPRTAYETVCVLALSTGTRTCFLDLRIYDYDWSPDGRSLVVRSPGRQPLRTIDLATGEISTLVPFGGDRAFRKALAQAGVGAGEIFFSQVAWSPSGRYLLTTPGGVPAIFHRDGTFAAIGRGGIPDHAWFAWSPTEDVLAYTNARSLFAPWRLYLLDVETGKQRLLLREEPPPFPTGLAWSPSGRWLALAQVRRDGSVLIRLLDLTGDEPPRRIALSPGVPDPLKDWGPAP